MTGSSLVLGDCDDCVYFDSEGNFGSGKMKKRTSQNFTRDQAALLLKIGLFRERQKKTAIQFAFWILLDPYQFEFEFECLRSLVSS